MKIPNNSKKKKGTDKWKAWVIPGNKRKLHKISSLSSQWDWRTHCMFKTRGGKNLKPGKKIVEDKKYKH